MLKIRPIVWLLAALLSSLSVGRAEGAFVANVSQVGGNVFASGSGTLDTSGLTFTGSNSSFPQLDPFQGGLIFGVAAVTPVQTYGGFSGPASFGTTTTPIFADAGTGDPVGVFAAFNYVVTPVGYVSGSALSGTATFDNATFATLGLTPGTYVYTWGAAATQNADSLTVNVGPTITSVGLPAGFWGGAGVLGACGLLVVGKGGRRVCR